MKHTAILLLLLFMTLGLVAQQPMAAMGVATMSQADMSAMPDCMVAMTKDVAHKPCKCGLAGCIAMMNSSASMMLADVSSAPVIVAVREQIVLPSSVVTLHGRSTAPEPEPPSILT